MGRRLPARYTAQGMLAVLIGLLSAPITLRAQACRTTRTTEAGVRHIVSTGEPCWPDARPWRLERLWSVGSIDGPSSFGGVAAAYLTEGHVIVLDDRNTQVRVLDLEGRERNRFGRSGQGPGEFANPVSLRARGDTLAVLDARQRRVSRFTLTGELIDERSLPLHYATQGTPSRIWQLAAGHWVVQTTRGIGLTPDSSENRFHLYLVDPADSTVYHLHTSAIPAALAGRSSRMALAVQAPRWGPVQSYAMTPDGRIVHGDGRDFTIRVGAIAESATGAELRIREILHIRSGSRERISRTELAEFEARGRPRAGTSPTTTEALAAAIASYPVPERWPSYSDLLVADDGTVWAYEVPRVRESAGRYHILSAEGIYLGSISVPPRTKLLDVGGHYAIGLRRDELDVDYVDLFRVQR